MEFFDKELKVRLTFIEEVLGVPASKSYRDYIAQNLPTLDNRGEIER